MMKFFLSFAVILTLFSGIDHISSAEETDKTAQPVDKKVTTLDEKEDQHTRFEDKEDEKASFASQDKKEDVKRTVAVEATAYTAFCEGCSGTTYTGIDLRANPDQKVIAVDPSVIPLGSTVRVPGYGTATAGDIGGDIEGHRIDLFMAEERDAFDYGRRQIEVEILE
ncbi:3D domain-containing protein [Halobacillus kuroshimensis]